MPKVKLFLREPLAVFYSARLESYAGSCLDKRAFSLETKLKFAYMLWTIFLSL